MKIAAYCEYTVSFPFPVALWNVTYYNCQWTCGLSSGAWCLNHCWAVLQREALHSDGPSLGSSASCVTLGKSLNLSVSSTQNSSRKGKCSLSIGWLKVYRIKGAEFRCKLLYIEWINNKVPLPSTGNYIQCPVINHNGKEYEKECICITESLCCTAETNTL